MTTKCCLRYSYSSLIFATSFSCPMRFAWISEGDIKVWGLIRGGVFSPFRLTQASTEIPAKTITAPIHWPAVSLWLYMNTEKSIVKSFLVSVIVLEKDQDECERGSGGSQTYTRVKEPKCCRVSKMNS